MRRSSKGKPSLDSKRRAGGLSKQWRKCGYCHSRITRRTRTAEHDHSAVGETVSGLLAQKLISRAFGRGVATH